MLLKKPMDLAKSKKRWKEGKKNDEKKEEAKEIKAGNQFNKDLISKYLWVH